MNSSINYQVGAHVMNQISLLVVDPSAFLAGTRVVSQVGGQVRDRVWEQVEREIDQAKREIEEQAVNQVGRQIIDLAMAATNHQP